MVEFYCGWNKATHIIEQVIRCKYGHYDVGIFQYLIGVRKFFDVFPVIILDGRDGSHIVFPIIPCVEGFEEASSLKRDEIPVAYDKQVGSVFVDGVAQGKNRA